MTGTKGLTHSPAGQTVKDRYLNGSRISPEMECMMAYVPPAILKQIFESDRKEREKLALANAARNKKLAERKAVSEPEQQRQKAQRAGQKAARKLEQQSEKQVGV
jgi:hypothetical protein